MLRKLLCRWFRLTPNEVAVAQGNLTYDRGWNDALKSVPEPEPVTARDIMEQLSGWQELWDIRDIRPMWPRICNSEVWRNDLEPFYKHTLLATLVQLTHERDPDMVLRLQERASLINFWLEEPRLGVMRERARLNNAFGSGNAALLDEEMKRANPNQLHNGERATR